MFYVKDVFVNSLDHGVDSFFNKRFPCFFDKELTKESAFLLILCDET
jgi:hypothetical protein